MDRDFAAAQRNLPPLDPASCPTDDGPAFYRPAHSPPSELASDPSSASPSRRKFVDEAGRQRRPGAPRRQSSAPDAAGDPETLGPFEGGGGGGGESGGGGGGGGGSVYTQLQTELYPHMNFF